MGDRFDRSSKSEQTESVEEDDDANSKGGAYWYCKYTNLTLSQVK